MLISAYFYKKLKGIKMEELTIKFLNITTIKFIGKREYIELIRKYYPGL